MAHPFLLCSEGLSNLLKQACAQQEISGMRISKEGPIVTHLFFADDSLIFTKANRSEAEKIMEVLHKYEIATGQMINLQKSSVFFSKNISREIKEEICQNLGGIQFASQGKYLGLPMVISRSKAEVFGFIKDNVQSRLVNWKGKLLSSAGREVLLKSVVMALPTYLMSCFKIPKKICKGISSYMNRYWQGNNVEERKVHLVSWEKLTAHKLEGGLGFKDLVNFNKALLTKQIWRLITKPNLLVSKVLKAKYYNQQDIFKAKIPKNASWIWQSLSSVRDFLEEGLRWRVGNGCQIKVWEDRWIPYNDSGKVRRNAAATCDVKMVEELICNFRWDRDKVLSIFAEEDAQNIFKIPVSLSGRMDSLYWAHSNTGIYTVSSAYNRCKQMAQQNKLKDEGNGSCSAEGQKENVWRSIWGLQTRQKLKHFLWKCLHRALPTNDLMYNRFHKGEPWCKCCGEDRETLEHMFFFCKDVQNIWKVAPIKWDGLEDLRWNFWRWWEGLLEAKSRPEGQQHIELTVCILWEIWKQRNNIVFNDKRANFTAIMNKAWISWQEGKEGISTEDNVQNLTQNHWSDAGNVGMEAQDMRVLHTSVCRSITKNKTGFGIILRSKHGTLEQVWALVELHSATQQQEEAEAIRMALIKVRELGVNRIQVCIQSRILWAKLSTHNSDDGMLKTILEDILELSNLFVECHFLYESKDQFAISNRIAKFAIDLVHDIYWEFPFPLWISQFV